MRNRIYQKIINGLVPGIDALFGVQDETGMIIACSDKSLVDTKRPLIMTNSQYFPFQDMMSKKEVKVFIDAKGDVATAQGNLIRSSLTTIALLTIENDNILDFIQQVASGRFDKASLYERLKRYQIEETDRYVCVFRGQGISSSELYRAMEEYLVDWMNDFIYPGEHQTVVVVKRLRERQTMSMVESRLAIHAKHLGEQLSAQIQIGVSEPIRDLALLSNALRQATEALNACSACDPIKNVVRYDKMALSGLVANLSVNQCQKYINEILPIEKSIHIDDEMKETIRAFLENNLNVTNTSNQLFINRNTLIYRLNKIEKITGLDLRHFDDAMMMKMYLMIINNVSAQKYE